MNENPGLIILIGSGETGPNIRKVYKWLFDQLDRPVKIGILETPAGFEPNSAQVAGRVADYMEHHLQNYNPQSTVIPARKRNTTCSPDDPDLIAPLLTTNVNYLGAGSPTYAVRQLQDTLAWHTLVARHRLGAALILASASTLAFSAQTLPVYEIYKVGEELHWQLGLDFLGLYGLSLVFIPHWNNNEGGADLDTSRCYMGQARFEKLLGLLPPRQTIVGLDEHTALVLDLANEQGRVMGKGGMSLLRDDSEHYVAAGEQFSIFELGDFDMPPPGTVVPPAVWAKVKAAHQPAQQSDQSQPPEAVQALVEEREAARSNKDWAMADQLRDQISELGWQVQDTPQGPELEPV